MVSEQQNSSETFPAFFSRRNPHVPVVSGSRVEELILYYPSPQCSISFRHCSPNSVRLYGIGRPDPQTLDGPLNGLSEFKLGSEVIL